MTLAATYYGVNGWLLEINNLRVLVDPWLRGSLSFPPGSWLLKGVLPHERPAPGTLDLLLLTQGLADHSHPESLDLLPRDLPVIGSASAARVVRSLGFQTITSLKPGETTNHQGLTVRATPVSSADGRSGSSSPGCLCEGLQRGAGIGAALPTHRHAG